MAMRNAGPFTRNILLIVAIFIMASCRLAMEIPEGPQMVCNHDGVRDPGESCDGEDLGEFTCQRLGYHGGNLACGKDCMWDVSFCRQEGFCGDGLFQPAYEACEGMDLGGLACGDLGYSGGTLGCTAECDFDTSHCESNCNHDGVKDPWEACDHFDLGDVTCVELGFHGGDLYCNADCTLALGPCLEFGRCGDGVVDHTYEDCEGEELLGHSCESLGQYPGTLACDDSCRFHVSGCGGRCGDGTIQAGYETCDNVDFGGVTCEGLGQYPGYLSCNAACTIDDSGCGGRCGDGLIQTSWEQCEPGHPNNETCRGMSYFTGTLCASTCLYDVSGCQLADMIRANGYSTCTVLSDASLRCWGYNQTGQLGDGTTVNSSVPVKSFPLPQLHGVSVGMNHTCALTEDAQVLCWGDNAYGQLGDGTQLKPDTYTTVTGLSNIIGLRTGSYFTCARTMGGVVFCWGRNTYGQLGIGNSTNQYSPVEVSFPNTVASMDTGVNHACAIMAFDGSIRCWGHNGNGQLGDGTTNTRLVPTLISGHFNFVQVSTGGYHTCALKSSGITYCWGSNSNGQIGTGSTLPYNVLSPAEPDWGYLASFVTTGNSHSCAITTTGTLFCWGLNNSGQLGLGHQSTRVRPTYVGGIVEAVQLAAGDSHTCARLSTGLLKCWGLNNYGQLGDGTNVMRLVPVDVEP